MILKLIENHISAIITFFFLYVRNVDKGVITFPENL